jgi:uncharacterized membrane protein YfcA
MIPTYIILAVAALLTSILSAIIGMGGGILLLAVMFCLLDHAEAIPAHAAVQLASNGTRVLVFLRHVHWATIGKFWIGALPGIVAGTMFLYWLGELGSAEPWLKIVVGMYILISLVLPKPRGLRHRGRWWDWTLLGFAAGASALLVGAIGPLIAPLFARRDFVKENLIATKAVCQMSLHLLKIPAFFFIPGFQFSQVSLLAGVMVLMVIPGTVIGRRILNSVSEAEFIMLFKVALTLAGFKVLIVDGVYPLLSGWLI